MAYEIKEEGRNGSVEIDGNTIVRRFTKTLGNDDIQQIPLSGVTGVEVDNRPMRSDILTLHVNQQSYTWKMPDAQAFADEVMANMG